MERMNKTPCDVCGRKSKNGLTIFVCDDCKSLPGLIIKIIKFGGNLI